MARRTVIGRNRLLFERVRAHRAMLRVVKQEIRENRYLQKWTALYRRARKRLKALQQSLKKQKIRKRLKLQQALRISRHHQKRLVSTNSRGNKKEEQNSILSRRYLHYLRSLVKLKKSRFL